MLKFRHSRLLRKSSCTIGYDIPDRDPASLISKAPGAVVTDARSLYDVIQKGPQNTIVVLVSKKSIAS